MVLAFAKPKIQEIQDKAITEQSIRMMDDINSLIVSVIQGGPGNKRKIQLGIKKGELKIDSISDSIIFEIESKHTYSEPGKNISLGEIILKTEKRNDFNRITLLTDYSEKYNLTYNGEDKSKLLTKSPTPHNLFISNEGREGNKTRIDITIG